jgi:hypothetical protein
LSQLRSSTFAEKLIADVNAAEEVAGVSAAGGQRGQMTLPHTANAAHVTTKEDEVGQYEQASSGGEYSGAGTKRSGS